ncbi:DegV family protein, partial [Escherichia coli]|nr:DegV family protein [Escherichia coli]
VIFGNETYREEIDVTAEEYFHKIKDAKTLPTTSQPPIGEFVELYEQLQRDGYESAVVVTLSSGISGTYQGALSAREMVSGFDVQVY